LITKGGINIFSFIKENFIASLIPLWMDVKTFMEYKDQGIESNEADIRKLTTSLNNQTFFFVFLVLSQFFTLITLGHFFGKTMSTGRDVDLGYGK
jgi:hypothetical protein